jgi:hypothetical protein
MILRLSYLLQIVHEKYSLGGYTQFLGYTVRPLQRLSLLSVELEEVTKGQLPEILIVTGFTSMAVDAVAGLLASEREKEYADCCREYAHELLEFSSANRRIRVSFYFGFDFTLFMNISYQDFVSGILFFILGSLYTRAVFLLDYFF